MKNIEGGTIFSRERLAGQNEAWELAKRMISSECNGGFSFSQLKEIFGTADFFEAMAQNTYVETAKKIKAWSSKNIKVGDEYFSRLSETKFVVTRIESDTLYVIWLDGSTGQVNPSDIGESYTKTGRMFPVKDLLRQIGGQDE